MIKTIFYVQSTSATGQAQIIKFMFWLHPPPKKILYISQDAQLDILILAAVLRTLLSLTDSYQSKYIQLQWYLVAL
jgi:hypothetical protein